MPTLTSTPATMAVSGPLASAMTTAGVTSLLVSRHPTGGWSFDGKAHNGERSIHIAPGGETGHALRRALAHVTPRALARERGTRLHIARVGVDMHGNPMFLISSSPIAPMSRFMWSPARGWVPRVA